MDFFTINQHNPQLNKPAESGQTSPTLSTSSSHSTIPIKIVPTTAQRGNSSLQGNGLPHFVSYQEIGSSSDQIGESQPTNKRYKNIPSSTRIRGVSAKERQQLRRKVMESIGGHFKSLNCFSCQKGMGSSNPSAEQELFSFANEETSLLASAQKGQVYQAMNSSNQTKSSQK